MITLEKDQDFLPTKYYTFMFLSKNTYFFYILNWVSILLIGIIWWLCLSIYQVISTTQDQSSVISYQASEIIQEASWPTQDQEIEEVILDPEEVEKLEEVARQKEQERQARVVAWVQEIQQVIQNFEIKLTQLRESTVPVDISEYKCVLIDYKTWVESQNKFLWPYSEENIQILASEVSKINRSIIQYWVSSEIPPFTLQSFRHISDTVEIKKSIYLNHISIPWGVSEYKDYKFWDEYIFLSDSGRCIRKPVYKYIDSIDELPKGVPFSIGIDKDIVYFYSFHRPTLWRYALRDVDLGHVNLEDILSGLGRFWLLHKAIMIDAHRVLLFEQIEKKHWWHYQATWEYSVRYLDIKNKILHRKMNVHVPEIKETGWLTPYWPFIPISYMIDGDVYFRSAWKLVRFMPDTQTFEVLFWDWDDVALYDFYVAEDRFFVMIKSDTWAHFIAELERENFTIIDRFELDKMFIDLYHTYYKIAGYDVKNDAFLLSPWFIKISRDAVLYNMQHIDVLFEADPPGNSLVSQYISLVTQREARRSAYLKTNDMLMSSSNSEGSFMYLEFINH